MKFEDSREIKGKLSQYEGNTMYLLDNGKIGIYFRAQKIAIYLL